MLANSIAIQNEPRANAEDVHQYLTFFLNGQEYGLDLLKIREICGFTSVTAIPNMPSHIKGVMNLRGTVLPVIDLRLKFALPEKEYTKFTVIIIAKTGAKNVGLVVDSVSDVLTFPAHEITPPPDFGAPVGSNFVVGLLKVSDRLAILLDLEKLLTESGVSGEILAESNGN